MKIPKFLYLAAMATPAAAFTLNPARKSLGKRSRTLFLSTRTETNTEVDLDDLEAGNPWTDGMQLQKGFSYGDFANPFVRF